MVFMHRKSQISAFPNAAKARVLSVERSQGGRRPVVTFEFCVDGDLMSTKQKVPAEDAAKLQDNVLVRYDPTNPYRCELVLQEQ